MVNVYGQVSRVVARGRLNTTSHRSVLNSLSHCGLALPGCSTFGPDRNHAWPLDETGTIATDEIRCIGNNLCYNEVERNEVTEINKLDAPKELLSLHGSAHQKKPNGIVPLVYKNVNGIANRLANNNKVERAKEIHDDLEVDIVAYNEHQLNMRHRCNVNGFNQLFRGGETEIRSIVAHNVHENVGQHQQGGTSLMLFRPLIEQLSMDQSGEDDTGLGRWTVMTFQGLGVCTWIICGYNPCSNNKPDSGTVYQQHCRFFITQQKDMLCPRKLFQDHLVAQLSKWHADGNRLIVCLDANEDIYRKSLGKALTGTDGLSMKEVVGEFTGCKVGSTYFQGSKPINGIWATTDVKISNACIMPVGYIIGDHRMFIVDIVK